MRKKEKYRSKRVIVGIITAMILVASSLGLAFAQEIQTEGSVIRLGFAVNNKDVMTFEGDLKAIERPLIKSPLPVISMDGGTYVPVKAFGDALGYAVTFTPDNHVVGVSFEGKTIQLSPISKLEDLKNEMVYFCINGNSYVSATSFAKLEGLKIAEREGVYLYYTSPITDENTDPLTDVAAPAVGEGNTGEAITVTDELLQIMRKNVVTPTENYIQKVKSSYDNVYYKPFVNPYVPYQYKQMLLDVKKLGEQYPEYIKTDVVGKTVEGRDIVSMDFGNGSKHVYILGSHHAREYISTSYIMKFVNETAYAAKTGINHTGYDIKRILQNVTFHIIPMVNADGVNLVQNGIGSVSAPYRDKVRAMPMVDGSNKYQSWKSNINGVDLNRNYPANWSALKTKHTNASSRYPGPAPASEPEVQAVMKYLNRYPAEAIVSVHTQGEVIYWSNPERKMGEMGKKIIASSGFTPIVNTLDNSKAGFLSNYARETCKTYEITIELCKYTGPSPYPDARFDEVWAPAKNILLIVGDEVAKNPPRKILK